MIVSSVLWRRLDRPGHEYAMLERLEESWLLTGSALFAHDHDSCSLSYRVVCERNWTTRSADVSGWAGMKRIDVHVDGTGDVAGSVDIDLNFSPSTNLLPIRRLNLAIGESARVRAAWLRFPSFYLEPLEQTYTRLAERTYRYESAGGQFVADIEVNDGGLPLRYGEIWAAELGAPRVSA